MRGSGRRLDTDRRPVAGEALAVSLDSVARFESDELRVPGAMVPITVMAAVHGVISALCLTNPKACFGSCPTFYAWDGEREVLVAEDSRPALRPHSRPSTSMRSIARALALGDLRSR